MRLRAGGLILYGGRSSRMGSDKGALRFGTETLLQRVLARMASVADPLVIAVAADRNLSGLPPGVIVAADPAPYEGPLFGLAEGFRRLDGLAEAVAVVPVDMPFYTTEWIARSLAALESAEAALFSCGKIANALTGAYRMTLLPKLERLIAEGQRRPMALSQGAETTVIRVEDHWRKGESPPPLMDVDTAEDYRDALRWEGMGNPAGAAVIAEWPGLGPGGPGGLPLWAASPDEALHLCARVYPECEAELAALREKGRPSLIWEGGRTQVPWDLALKGEERVRFEPGAEPPAAEERRP